MPLRRSKNANYVGECLLIEVKKGVKSSNGINISVKGRLLLSR